MLSEGRAAFVEEIFSKCGYASAFVQEEQLKADKEKYLQLLLSYIDKGIPVISNLRIMGHPKWIVFVETRSGSVILSVINKSVFPSSS